MHVETRYGCHDLAPLMEFIAIPSVSGEARYEKEVGRAGAWVGDFISGIEGAKVEIVDHAASPIVVGRIITDAALPTVVIYGHFDVQPAGDSALWMSPPFIPTVADGWLYGRGAADDKGNFFMLVEAVRLLAAAGDLPVNVAIIADGEEEIGGVGVVEEIRRFEDANACIIFDGPMPARGQPVLTVAGRGLVSLRVALRTGDSEVHSGIYGGVALNAVNLMLDVLQCLRAVVCGGDAPTAAATADEVREWAKLPPGAQVLEDHGILPADDAAGEELYVRTFAGVAVDVTGVIGGEPGRRKNAIPNEATAFVSVRVPPGLDCNEIVDVLAQTAASTTPRGSALDTEVLVATPPARVPLPDHVRAAADAAFESVLGVRPLIARTGGTIPILGALAALHVPTILTGFDVPEGNAHAPNERLLLDYIPAGIETAIELLKNLGEPARTESYQRSSRPLKANDQPAGLSSST